MDYEAKIGGKLDEIAETVGKLENSIDNYQETDSRVMSFFEQKKALHEIKSILRKSDDIESYHQDEAERDIDQLGMYVNDDRYGLSPEENNEDVVLDRINTQMMRLDDTLEGADINGGQVKSYLEQKHALHEVKKILHEAGHFDGYRPNELDGFDSLYTTPQ